MRRNRFITGYSGLRALAVIGVILYHLDSNSFMGGYLGVPIFSCSQVTSSRIIYLIHMTEREIMIINTFI